MSKNKEFIQSEIKSDEQIGITKDEVQRIQNLGKVNKLNIFPLNISFLDLHFGNQHRRFEGNLQIRFRWELHRNFTFKYRKLEGKD